jgi:hypothetical protein
MSVRRAVPRSSLAAKVGALAFLSFISRGGIELAPVIHEVDKIAPSVREWLSIPHKLYEGGHDLRYSVIADKFIESALIGFPI